MLGVHVTYTMKPGEKNREEFLLGVRKVRPAVLQEEGCLQYEYFLPADDPDRVLLVEKWTSREAQQVHLTQPHMREITRLKKRYVQNTALEFFSLEEQK